MQFSYLFPKFSIWISHVRLGSISTVNIDMTHYIATAAPQYGNRIMYSHATDKCGIFLLGELSLCRTHTHAHRMTFRLYKQNTSKSRRKSIESYDDFGHVCGHSEQIAFIELKVPLNSHKMRLKPQENAAIAKCWLGLLGLLAIISCAECMYEDQVGKIDWYALYYIASHTQNPLFFSLCQSFTLLL